MTSRPEEGRKILQEFGRKSKTELSDEFLEKFENGMITDATKEAAIQHKQFSILDLFRDRRMGMVAANISIAFMIWICNYKHAGSLGDPDLFL